MNWRSVIKIFLGMIALLVVIILLLAYTDKQIGEVDSQEAKLISSTYTVGADFTSVVVKQYVELGDQVTVGQTMFELKSSALADALSENRLKVEELLYPLNDEGNIVISASKEGSVSKIYYQEGSFVPANSEIAEIIDLNSIKAEATFLLSPKEFALLKRDTKLLVRLPDGQEVAGTVENIDLVEKENLQQTIVTANLGQVDLGDFQLVNGAPVESRLILRQTRLYDKLMGLVRQHVY